MQKIQNEGRYTVGTPAEYTPAASTEIGMWGATRLHLLVQTQPVRIRFDGTAPTAAVGLLLPAGTYTFDVDPKATVKIIDTAAGASTCNVQLFR